MIPAILEFEGNSRGQIYLRRSRVQRQQQSAPLKRGHSHLGTKPEPHPNGEQATVAQQQQFYHSGVGRHHIVICQTSKLAGNEAEDKRATENCGTPGDRDKWLSA